MIFVCVDIAKELLDDAEYENDMMLPGLISRLESIRDEYIVDRYSFPVWECSTKSRGFARHSKAAGCDNATWTGLFPGAASGASAAAAFVNLKVEAKYEIGNTNTRLLDVRGRAVGKYACVFPSTGSELFHTLLVCSLDSGPCQFGRVSVLRCVECHASNKEVYSHYHKVVTAIDNAFRGCLPESDQTGAASATVPSVPRSGYGLKPEFVVNNTKHASIRAKGRKNTIPVYGIASEDLNPKVTLHNLSAAPNKETEAKANVSLALDRYRTLHEQSMKSDPDGPWTGMTFVPVSATSQWLSQPYSALFALLTRIVII